MSAPTLAEQIEACERARKWLAENSEDVRGVQAGLRAAAATLRELQKYGFGPRKILDEREDNVEPLV